MSRRTYLDEPIFDIPRIPENEELFASILDAESGNSIEKRDGKHLFEEDRRKTEDDIE